VKKSHARIASAWERRNCDHPGRVHPGAAAVEQDRPAGPAADGAVDGPADRRGQRDQVDLGALAAHPQHAVAVFLAQVGAGGFEDPRAQQPEPGHQGEVVVAGRFAGGGQQGFELQVSEPERGRFGRDIRPADMLGRGVLQYALDDAGAVEPGGHREPPGDGGGLEPAGLLHPQDVLLQVRAAGGQRVQAAVSAPSQVTAQVGSGVLTGGTTEPGQVGGRGADWWLIPLTSTVSP
jgi:hypothetical protein